jgi:hypothetical protein
VASFDNQTLVNGPGGVRHTDVVGTAVRDRRHPYCQCVSEVNAWLIALLFLFIVYKVVTKVVVGGLSLMRAGGYHYSILVMRFWFETTETKNRTHLNPIDENS